MAVEGNVVLCGLSSGQFELFDMPRSGTCMFRSTTTAHGALSAIATYLTGTELVCDGISEGRRLLLGPCLFHWLLLVGTKLGLKH
jgi:hypothetical protein